MRPAIHFTAERQWINDPNGLVHFQGEYHLFCQMNPDAPSWGHMSWGHAVSRDLLSWRHLEPALTPYPARTADAETYIFSGSALVDRVGLAGGAPGEGLLAYYTAHERRGDEPLNESVALATSSDGGRSWTRHPSNPLLDLGRRDFRDPKVFWHEPSHSMVMAIADPLGRLVEFYRSPDGLCWKQSGSFDSSGLTSMIWECPDLVEVPFESGSGSRWVLLVSSGHASGEPHTGMQYWIGDFDGATFVADDGPPRVVDFGKDFFAGVTFNDLPNGRSPVMIGWASNWAYASLTPTSPWRGTMAIPRELALRATADGPVLVQQPVSELESRPATPIPIGSSAIRLPHASLVGSGARRVSNLGDQPTERPTSPLIEGAAEVCWSVAPGERAPVGVRFVGEDDSRLDIWVDRSAGVVVCDRRFAGNVDFSPTFASIDSAALPARWNDLTIDVRLLFDDCIVEVFACGGEVVLTELVFPVVPWRIEPLGSPDGLSARSVES